ASPESASEQLFRNLWVGRRIVAQSRCGRAPEDLILKLPANFRTRENLLLLTFRRPLPAGRFAPRLPSPSRGRRTGSPPLAHPLFSSHPGPQLALTLLVLSGYLLPPRTVPTRPPLLRFPTCRMLVA